MMVRIAVGDDPGHVENKTVPWSKLAKVLTTHKQADTKGGRFFVGGHFASSERREDQLVERTLLTFDADKVNGMSLDDIELALEFGLNCALAAYSTHTHTTQAPRLRVVIPLSRGVSPNEYRHISKTVGVALGIPLDACSFKPNQFMYLPTAPDLSQVWSLVVEGEPLTVDQYLPTVIAPEPPADDLESALAAQPLDLDEHQVVAYLRALDPAGMDYDEWVRVGAALHHQMGGSTAGQNVWRRWSKQDAERFDADTIASKWASFGKSTRQVTFASVIHMVKEAGGMSALPAQADGATALETLLDECRAVTDQQGHMAISQRVSAMPRNLLCDIDRAQVAEALHKSWAKGAGVGKVDVKRALAPPKRERGGNDGESPTPGWADPWVYVEVPCVFAHTELGYQIKREAFNTKYAGESECIGEFGRPPATVFSQSDGFRSVTDCMYWPGAALFYKYEGREMLNTYRPSGVAPCETLDDDGQTVVYMFLAHTATLLPDTREQTILLDWLAYVVQHPGNHANWAIVLQGAQGCGKSYYANVMQAVLGDNARQVSVSDIMGRFTGWAAGAMLAVIEEIRISGDSKYAVIDRMKSFIANNTISIEAKGRDAVTVPNFTSYLMLTNHRDAIPVDEGDRRYCVMFSAMQSKADVVAAFGGGTDEGEGDSPYFRKLFAESSRRADALAHYLSNRPISASFDAHGKAPMTTAKAAMQNLAVTSDTEQVIDAIDTHRCAIINERIVDVTHLQNECLLAGNELPKTSLLSKIISEMGYAKATRRVDVTPRTGGQRKKHTVWFLTKSATECDIVDEVKQFHNDPDYIPF